MPRRQPPPAPAPPPPAYRPPGYAPIHPYGWAKPIPQPRKKRVWFSGKLAVGAGLGTFYEHPVYGVTPMLGLGAEFEELGAVHANFSGVFGSTDLLSAYLLHAGASWEFILWRFRLGAGLFYERVEFGRVTTSGSLIAQGPGLELFASFDLYQSQNFDLYVDLNGSAAYVGDDEGIVEGTLRLGGRVKAR